MSTALQKLQQLKEKHPGAVFLFRCGDFYEAYEDDAAGCASVLGVTLTVRNDDRTRMAIFPRHALDTYLPKLIRAGHRVAICDQLENPEMARKLEKRRITELVQPQNALSPQGAPKKHKEYKQLTFDF